MKAISLKLPERLDAKLATAAKRRRKKKSEIVREALEAYLRTPADEGRPGSFLDLARDLAGSVESGVSDLATNPKYMEGYGR